MSDQAARVDATEAALLGAARELGMVVSADGRIRECDAEILLCYSAGYLRALRDGGAGPAHFRVGVAGSKISYALADLATWLVSKREEEGL